MRILYGVVGEGMGHATRSTVIVEHLLAQGHEVEIMASQRAVDFLKRSFPKVRRIHGYHMILEENRVRTGKTLWSNVQQGAKTLPGQIQAYFDVIRQFEPEAVVSDFESWTYLYAKSLRLPILSVDNIQMVNRGRHSDAILEGVRPEFELARAFVKSKLPFCDHYLVTTFFYPEVRKDRTSFHPPVLRPDVLRAEAESGDHLLVYQTAEGHEELAKLLSSTGLECRIYGMRRDITHEQREGTLSYRPFSEQGFVNDLRTCRAVVSGGGFTLMSESVFLHKPMLAVPVERQFEQIMNARYLEHSGYGVGAEVLDADTLGRFLERVPDYQRALSGYSQDGNKALLSALDGELDNAAAGLY